MSQRLVSPPRSAESNFLQPKRLATAGTAGESVRRGVGRSVLGSVLLVASGLIASSMLLTACGGGGGGGSSSQMVVEEVSNGFGRLLPFTTFRLNQETSLPTTDLIEIRSIDQLFENVNESNPILPATQWPETATLPGGSAGNQFIYARFRQDIDVDSVLDAAISAAANNSLRGTITVLAVDPLSGQTTPVVGRAFIGGKTYGQPDPDLAGALRLEQWVTLDGGGNPRAVNVDGATPGFGFPGTEQVDSFSGARLLVEPRTFVFVPDSDGNLLTHETFPVGVQITMRISTEVRSADGRPLRDSALASSTVGADLVSPEIAISGAAQVPTIIPGNGELDVDPETNVLIEFSEPVEPSSVGPFDDGSLPTISSAILLEFGPTTSTVTVPYTIRPVSPLDLSRYILIPSYPFPGEAEELGGGIACGEFSEVRVRIGVEQFRDPAGVMNTVGPVTSFNTGQGPGLVNAPVTPDVVYVGRGGSEPGISVIDLNGFGGGTGNPTFDPFNPLTPGNSRFPLNPNVSIQGSNVCPQLTPGTCTFNGGSSGVFTLTRDSGLNDKLARAPIVTSIADMVLGHALDTSFNAALPNGCQAGGGNICANTGLKIVQLASGPQGQLTPAGVNLFPTKIVVGGENLVTFAPHPNPPPMVFPPLCLSPLIGAQEPTNVDTAIPVMQGGKGLTNLLGPGDPFGNPSGFPQQPPSGLLAITQNSGFNGPSLPSQNIATCFGYSARQQIGQFLYVCDRIAQQVVVLNSNRFTVIDRISVTDPTQFAFSPNLDFLAVTNEGGNTVTFIDTDPGSASFHEVIRVLPVGVNPTGIAWDPAGEAIFVTNRGDNSLSVISGFTFTVRKTVIATLSSPFQVVATPRQFGFGFNRGVHFAYIMSSNGRVSVYESGPGGQNGWGFDEIIGSPPMIFNSPKDMVIDHNNLNSGIWVAHEDQLGLDGLPTGIPGGAVTNMVLNSATNGQIPLSVGVFGAPGLRDMEWAVRVSIGSTRLSGLPVSIAFDNLSNSSALDNFTSQFSPAGSVTLNGKAIVKQGPFQANRPQFMFVAIPEVGVVDVVDIGTGTNLVDTNAFEPGVQSIPVPGANLLMDYFSQ